MSNTKSGLEQQVKSLSDMAGIGLNQRTRLKIALTEIMTEQGHDVVKIQEAIADVCNCDFRALRTMFGLEPGRSHADPEYKSFYRDEDAIQVGDEYAVCGNDWWKVKDVFVLSTDKLIVEWTDEERCHMNVFRDDVNIGMLHVQWAFMEKDFEKVEA